MRQSSSVLASQTVFAFLKPRIPRKIPLRRRSMVWFVKNPVKSCSKETLRTESQYHTVVKITTVTAIRSSPSAQVVVTVVLGHDLQSGDDQLTS